MNHLILSKQMNAIQSIFVSISIFDYLYKITTNNYCDELIEHIIVSYL